MIWLLDTFWIDITHLRFSHDNQVIRFFRITTRAVWCTTNIAFRHFLMGKCQYTELTSVRCWVWWWWSRCCNIFWAHGMSVTRFWGSAGNTILFIWTLLAFAGPFRFSVAFLFLLPGLASFPIFANLLTTISPLAHSDRSMKLYILSVFFNTAITC